jgi:CRP-like cAMP-binding protein
VGERTAPANQILTGLPPRELQQLLLLLEPVSLAFGQVLYQPGVPIRHVYFPLDCLVSLLTEVDRRRTLEVGMVGAEGMTGMSLPLGIAHSDVRALVQGAGEALRLPAAALTSAFNRSSALRKALLLYAHSLMAQISQTAACNRFHDSEERLARWLLMTADRVGSGDFALTQEFLAHMLGLRRVGVTEAAGQLKRRRLITYTRGHLQILDRRGLERASCSCYQRVNSLLAQYRD